MFINSRFVSIRTTKLVIVGLLLSFLPVSIAGITSSTAFAQKQSGNKEYSSTVNAVPAPAGTFAAGSGGDGWGISVYKPADPTKPSLVVNVFHNATGVTVDCHFRASGYPCWAPTPSANAADVNIQVKADRTVTGNYASSDIFNINSSPGQWVDQSTGYLYAFGVDSSTKKPGVVIFNLTVVTAANATTAGTGFVNFIPLDAALSSNSGSNLSNMVNVGNRVFAALYTSTSTPAGSKLLCYDVSTSLPCSGNPYLLPNGSGTISAQQIGTFGGNILIPVGSSSSVKIDCVTGSTNAKCSTWQATEPTDASFSGRGSAFPILDTMGAAAGVCLPDAAMKCWDLNGALIASTDARISALYATARVTDFGGSTNRNGPAVTVGTRVYIPIRTPNLVECFDFANAGHAASCANFPFNAATGGASGVYTLTTDPGDATCLWLNSDKSAGTLAGYTVKIGQMQNFDAYTASTCGSSGTRVSMSSYIASNPTCAPTAIESIQVSNETHPEYVSGFGGTVNFTDASGNPLRDASNNLVPEASIDTLGDVAFPLSLNNLPTGTVPQFLIRLTYNGAAVTDPIAVDVTWWSDPSYSCTPPALLGAPLTITFDVNGGNVLTPNSETTTLGGALSTSTSNVGWTDGLPANPTHPSIYAFLGWFTARAGGTVVDSSTVPSGSVTYYAHWAEPFTIHFNANYPSAPAIDPETVTAGSALNTSITSNFTDGLPTTQPSYSTYPFLGWFTSQYGGVVIDTSTVPLSNGQTYYAHWSVPIYLTFDPNGGTALTNPTETVTAGATIASASASTGFAAGGLPSVPPTKAGFIFDNWYETVTATTPLDTNLTSPIVDTTYWAKWKVLDVTTTVPTSVGSTTATFTGGAVSGNTVGSAFTANFFCYAADPQYDSSTVTTSSCPAGTTKVDLTAAQANYSVDITGLTPSTHYWYILFGVLGSLYNGDWIDFTTNDADPAPAPSNPTPLYPTITWPNPNPQVGPYPLSPTQLNAVCSVPGSTLTYNPTLGTVLQPGNHALSVTCVPPAGSGYSPISTVVIFLVTPPAQTAPTYTLTWSTPAPQVGPVRLSPTQLNATCSIPGGKIVYTPTLGTRLEPGSYTLTAVCTPPAGSKISPITTTVQFVVTSEIIRLDPPIDPIEYLKTGNSSFIGWNASPNATGYFVTISDRKVCVTVATLHCNISELVGPNSDVKIYATKGSLTSAFVVPTLKKSAKPQVIGMVYFDSAKFNIKADQRAEIKRVVGLLKKLGYTDVIIGGHTDSNAYDNLTLSNNRATATEAALAALVPGLNADLHYSGATQPMASNSTLTGQAKNRRAEISVW